jgi:phosphomannomutase
MPQAMLRGIMAQIELQKHPEAKVCYDIRPGKITLDLIQQAGGKPIVTKVGHSLIKAKMLAEDAIFGGESSGHYFYQFDYGSFEAPVLLIAKFLKYLSEKEQTLAQIIDDLKTYHHSGEINSMVDDKDAVLKRIAGKYSDAKISYLDGITVTYDDFWFNVRPSNTEPKIRLNLEARTEELMKEKRDEVISLIRQ